MLDRNVLTDPGLFAASLLVYLLGMLFTDKM
jgi:hypothetical protein